MERKMSATEARVRFGEVIRAVTETDNVVVVERGGQPQVVVLSLAAYRRLQARGDADQRLDAFRRAIQVAAEVQGALPVRLLTPAEDVVAEGREGRALEIETAAGGRS